MPQSAYSAQPGSGDTDGWAGSVDGTGVRKPSEVTVVAARQGDRVLVTVSGELDLQTEEVVRRALRSALAESARGIDLDLSGVGFCDCSTLNVLLGVRQQALKEAKTVLLRATGRVVERVLDLTDTRSLFTDAEVTVSEFTDTGVTDTGGTDSAVTDPEADESGDRPGEPEPERCASTDDGEGEQDRHPEGDSAQDPRIEMAQLRRAMQTRPTIDLARGILMASFRLSPEDAWTTLVRTSQNTNTKMHHLAQDLVNTVRGDPLPEGVQKQLSAAVATLREPAAAPDDE
ncbi:anti-sigma factor antagonist [Streptomyces cellulosae]|uniref:anti-sigma factor antagonist n=1 Tax=Streptomyces cellulosae TaxID=1968 RepID=UPI00056B64EA|nr:anti-sigma factor antagonist [Streptomyces cellulosae]